MDYDYSTFITHLQNLMDAHGQSLRDASASLGISAPTLSRYLTGQRIPDLSYAIRIAQYYNVPIAWLLGLNSSRYEQIPDEIKTIVELYQIATVDDRAVIDLILSKYKE